MKIHKHNQQRKRNKEQPGSAGKLSHVVSEKNQEKREEGKEGSRDGLDGGSEVHHGRLVVDEEVEDAVGDADDSTGGEERNKEGI